MILNERQYRITRGKLKEFEQAIIELQDSSKPETINEELRLQAHLDTLTSQVEEFREEIEEYETLKKGNIKSLTIDTFEELPVALIKARIIRGWTQQDLADVLNVHQQQVQRDENNKYASASFAKISQLRKALNIEIKEEIVFQ